MTRAMIPAMTPLVRAFRAGLLALVALTPPAAAQAQVPAKGQANGLDRARAIFAAADRDANGRLTLDELRANRLAVTEREFTGEDHDGDKVWSRDEFTVHFRTLLARSGERPSADLDAEVVRVLGLRRVRTVDEARGKPGPGAGRSTGGSTPAPVRSVVPAGPRSRVEPAPGRDSAPLVAGDKDAQIEQALAELESKSVAREATRADFARVRDLWTERSSAVQREGPAGAPPDPVVARFARALDALEARARAGAVTRADFADLRAAWAARARRAVIDKKPAENAPASIEARFDQALAELEAKAFARGATRADWQRVKDLLVERARRAVQGPESTPPAADDPRVKVREAELAKALEALETANAEGRLTRAGFQEFRALAAAPPARK
jgi:hypothetical protein